MTDTPVAACVGPAVAARAPALTSGLERLFAAAVGVIVLPLYAPQPLVNLIGSSLGLVAMTPCSAMRRASSCWYG